MRGMADESLSDEIARLMREPASATALGMTGWVEGAEGVQRIADEADVATWNASVRELVFAMLEGQRNAITRLAKKIEEQDASR